ncbi:MULTISPECIES: imidazolonepropionase [unclassified Pseudoalteromonas]|uniref:imidazolonepropionase n=1 Tax=unclassified Pseudoalteromonas TaxID=194690 RepID=UPI0023583E58|nr:MULTISPECIES: imidazolonepropionase [unclassified Pseudoalteromonas]MDC9564547.1 imidazolonepropionase [Pseudoalteromonas sp. GAB2316C]MDC9567848.1 imidazolonepropionase [Pseudoalteromonas sp. GABNB9D]MDC9571637.1 imidazolonepropionase [Pseudoalteromonas sp. GABNS16A]MDC9576040.1 imidazolonepropionase [Pseudoalteromonas sp. GABNS16E]MDC9585010.1 imidazolonepropionase [Pseudoalteromonas sp. GABNS16C]
MQNKTTGYTLEDLDLLLTDANIATMDSTIDAPYGAIENAALAIKNGEIVWLGEQSNLPSFDAFATPTLSIKGQWLTPGLIDCHTHLIFAGSRAEEFEQRLQGVSYEQIAAQGGGIASTVKATREADHEQLFVDAKDRLNTLLAEGVTTAEIKSGYGLDVENEIKILEVARLLNEHHPIDIKTTFLGAHALPPEYKGRADEYIDLVCTQMLEQVVANNLADAVDVFCENVGFSLAQTKQVFDAATKHNLPVKCHAEQLSNQQGAQLVAEYKGLSADHIEYLDENGVKAMAEAGTVAVLLPGAFYFLRETQLPPIDLLQKYNVPIAIASDFNPGTSPLCSVQLMMNMACTLFRLTPEQALAGVTRNAAQALGLKDRGVLKVGARADIAHWQISHPAQLSYQFGVNKLLNLWILGRIN